MEKQAEQLKLNVTNIKSVLINSDKKLGKIRATNSALKRKELQQAKQEAAEKKIEMPRIPVVSQVFGTIKGVATSFLDKVLGFLGSILIGFVVTKLPEIMEGMKKVYDFVKPIWDGAVKTFSVIAGGFKFIYDNIASIFSPSEAKKELGAADDTLKGLDKEITSENLERELSETPGGDVEDDVDMPEPPSETPTPTPVTPTPTQTGGTPQLQLQPRNKGGEVTKTTQPNQQPHVRRGVSPNEMGKLNPFRMYPAIALSQKEMLKEHEKNNEMFQKVIKDLGKGSMFDTPDFSGGRDGFMNIDGIEPTDEEGGPGTGKVIEYITGDRSSRNYAADHGGGNYHDHIAFDSKATRNAAISWLMGKGWYIGSKNDGRHAPGSYHYSDQAFDIPFYPNQSMKGFSDDARGETGLSSLLRKDLSEGGFSGAGISGKPGASNQLGPVNKPPNQRFLFLPIQVSKPKPKPRPKSNPAVSMVNSMGKKKKANPLHNIP